MGRAIALKFSRFRGNCIGPKSDGLASGHTGRRIRRRISFRAVPTGRSDFCYWQELLPASYL